uniref:Uncharacterized protein LOC101507481 n=1 Tax=Cicer arietinum TaxID=3827 RepID=A0A1S2Z2E6_CICAR|nr:uncharacterized protein LOC101507481 [Cicer arietinum]
MARIKMTAKRKTNHREPEENPEVYSSTDSEYHEETHSEGTFVNTIPSSQPSKSSSSPSFTKKTAKNSSSSTPIRRSSRIISRVVSSNKPTPKKSISKASTPKKVKPFSPKPPSSSLKISDITSLFDSADIENNYVLKWQNKSVVNGKIIDLTDIKQGGFNVEEMVEQLGWTSFFKIDEPQYPCLVRAFYAAANGSKYSTSFSMVLKGVHMEINPTILCQILDIRDEGADHLPERWLSRAFITRTSVLEELLIKPPKPLVASNLRPICRILHNICVHSIAPRAGSFEKVTDLDIMIIHHLMTASPLHLGNVIFWFMLNVVLMGRSAPYGMLLTKIFKFFKIPLEDEPSIKFNSTFSLKNIKQMKFEHENLLASKKRKVRESSTPYQNSEKDTIQPPPKETPSPLIQKPTSPLRHFPDLTPNSPVQPSPPHEVDPLPKDTFTPTPLQNMEEGEELYFDLNQSYPPSPTDMPMAFSPTTPMEEDVLPQPDLTQQLLIPPAAAHEEPTQPLPEVTGQSSSLDSFFTATTHNQSKDKAGSS